MAVKQEYRPEVIEDTQFPGVLSGTPVKTTNSKSTFYPEQIPDVQIPKGFIARDVINSKLNTQTGKILSGFSFSRQGAIMIGYANGDAGIYISGAGILARNTSGTTTFAIDRETGDVTIKGTLVAGSVVTGYIAVGGAAGDVNGGATTISGGKITTGSITASQIAANTITANEIAGSTITAAKIASGTITATQIATGTITASLIAAGTITANEIAGSTITASKIAAGTITGTQITSSLFQTTSQYITGGLKVGGSGESISGIKVDGCCFLQSGNKLKLENNIDGNQKNIDNIDTVYADSYQYNSDRRMKKDIENIVDSTSILLQLQPVKYKFKHKAGQRYGFIAQDVKKILPEVVGKDSNDMLTMSYMEFIALMVQSIQEIDARIKVLEV